MRRAASLKPSSSFFLSLSIFFRFRMPRSLKQENFSSRVSAELSRVKKIEAPAAQALLAEVEAQIAQKHYHSYLIETVLPVLMDLQEHKSEPVRKQAAEASIRLASEAGAHAVSTLVPALLKVVVEGKWRAKMVAFATLERLVDLFPAYMSRVMSDTIAALQETLFDTKPRGRRPVDGHAQEGHLGRHQPGHCALCPCPHPGNKNKKLKKPKKKKEEDSQPTSSIRKCIASFYIFCPFNFF
jgi:hypothetical protein